MKFAALSLLSFVFFSRFTESSVVSFNQNAGSNQNSISVQNPTNQQTFVLPPEFNFQNLRANDQSVKGDSNQQGPPPKKDPPPKQDPPPKPSQDQSAVIFKLADFSRSFDGTGNNANNLMWGSTGQPDQRYCNANYKDGISVMLDNLPNPRDLSNKVGALNGPIVLSKLNWNMVFPIWGQFVDHDIVITKSGSTQSIPIPIPLGDPTFDSTNTGIQSFPLKRSAFDQTKPANTPRTQINSNTAWLDAGMIYGSNKATADSLRTFSQGKLKTTTGNLLPIVNGFFSAGDSRVNENIGLTAMHTVFMREHNRICDVVIDKDKKGILTDEQIYQIARNYVIGLVQHITYDDFLPSLLGRPQFDAWIGPYQHQPELNPNIFTEFSTAAYRIGHPMINTPFKLIENDGTQVGVFSLGQMFFNPALLTTTTFHQILNGMIRTNAKERSLELVDQLRNFLTLPSLGGLKIDLFSINVQRGRDHGICSWRQARTQMGLSDLSFNDIFVRPDKAQILQNLYTSTDKLDLWIGIIGQKNVPGSDLSELGGRIVAMQFKNIRNSDKNWYQNTYPNEIIKQIKRTSLGDIIKRNTDVTSVNSRTFVKL